MPLLDHFHPPWSIDRPWGSFHGAWANAVAHHLNHGVLRRPYVAMPFVHYGRVEIDVGTLRAGEQPAPVGGSAEPEVWTPPQAVLSAVVDLSELDSFEVRVVNDEEGPTPVAAIELVSPANKDRTAHRQAFAVKCASYLQEQIALVVVDIVTNRAADLHADLLRLLSVPTETTGRRPTALYAAAYRTVPTPEALQLEAWLNPVVLGGTLPTMPLWLSATEAVPVNLEEAYMSARTSLLMT